MITMQTTDLPSTTRIWTSDDPDDGSIHCLGNGQLCVYEQGPNILQVFGPPYSSPVLGALTLEVDGDVRVVSSREPGTAIWTHRLESGGAAWAEMVDFVDPALSCFVRRIRTQRRFGLKWSAAPSCTAVDDGGQLGSSAGGWLYEAAAGTPFYSRYPYPRPVFCQVAWRGSIVPREAMRGWECQPGEIWLYLMGGPEYPQTVVRTETALALPGEAMLGRTRTTWQAFTRSRHDWAARLPEQMPLRDALLRAVDDVSVLIKAQQSAEGGVLAGHNYHLCYVRDQYGVSRGLLEAGHHAEARAILEFYWRIWQRHGRIHNAQAAGVDGAFHVHENDEVEITGYLVRQAFDLLRATASARDADFVDGIFPMLAWAYEAQKRHLIGDMLPFNGDETYVAGGILPRTALNDGSAEATLLFLDSGTRLVDWAARQGHWAGRKVEEERALLARVRGAYHTNFWADGQLAANNPLRAGLPGGSPRFRHGVCQRCIAEGRFRSIGWTERSPGGSYLCPECLARGDDTPVEPRRYRLQSVSLTPLYFRSDLFDKEELRPAVETIVRSYQRTGRLPSRPDDGRDVTVGYDYGFLLYALTERDYPEAREIAEKTLLLADPTGAWVEYYVGHQPAGTRCRPWESAINLEALLHWAAQYWADHHS